MKGRDKVIELGVAVLDEKPKSRVMAVNHKRRTQRDAIAVLEKVLAKGFTIWRQERLTSGRHEFHFSDSDVCLFKKPCYSFDVGWVGNRGHAEIRNIPFAVEPLNHYIFLVERILPAPFYGNSVSNPSNSTLSSSTDEPPDSVKTSRSFFSSATFNQSP